MLINALRAVLAPPLCHACDTLLTQQEHHLCFNCLGQIPFTGFEHQPLENELFYRLAGKVPLAGAAGMFYFDKAGKLQRLVSQIKYHNAVPLARYLGELWGAKLAETTWLPEGAVLVPVPLHWRKQLRRGYNQAEMIAQGLGRELAIPLERNLLRRARFTPSQTRLSGTQRWQNVVDAFQVRQTPPRRIIMVDDVITTGATLEACIRALYAVEQPPEAVYLLSIGVARKH